ncbi:monooxygenase [Thozetella sp. PMI_491]|nr:monooxygenase [Thozetella sp. PMI_491]
MEPEWDTTDVIICGCGPTGAMLSAYLGRMNIPNIVIEKEPDITTDPRGITLDEDGLRYFQGLGLYDHIFTEIGSTISRLRFVGGVHHDLNKIPFMSLDIGSTAGITGHVGAITQKQPTLEKHLRSKIAQEPSSELRSSCELISIREEDDWVYAVYIDSAKKKRYARARFLVGADGKTGFVRKVYLEPKGVQLLWAERTRYQETWVALNWKIQLPTPDTHPNFPLWSLGYSPEQVYDLFFPAEFRFLCNPQRPAVCGRFGLLGDRLWRFEFVVAAGEDDAEMATQPMIEKVVMPYLTHAGTRYGFVILTEEVRFPTDCIEVLRCRPFRFSARCCDKWALGRVILCGDAAHVFPPFGGQGIASGFRDAISLSWRLALACRSNSIDFHKALEGWYTERKQQLEMSLASTVRNGDKVNSRNPISIFIRDWGLWLLQMIPAVKSQIELGPRADGPVRYRYEPTAAFVPELGGGACFPQTYCISLETTGRHSRVQFTDDVIFSKHKKSLFQIVVLMDGLEQLEPSTATLHGLDQICSRLCPEEASFFVRREALAGHPNPTSLQEVEVFRTATTKEFESSTLCLGRPPVRGHKEDIMWLCAPGKRYVIVRLDRFVFAACNTRRDLERAAERLEKLFPV